MDETEEIIKNIEDDTIKRAAFLLSNLIKKYPIEEALEKTQVYLNKDGWLLKTEDKEFLDKIHMRSYRDICKWIDYNMKKIDV